MMTGVVLRLITAVPESTDVLMEDDTVVRMEDVLGLISDVSLISVQARLVLNVPMGSVLHRNVSV